jgi:hypothetical protein
MWGVLEVYTALIGGVDLPTVEAYFPRASRQYALLLRDKRVLAYLT